ncbi:MAG: hypothetical protein ABJN73_07955 [Nonlabens ulvanivorans]
MRKTLIYRFLRLLFLVILAAWIFVELSTIFTPKRDKLPWNTTSKIKGFYELEDNSIDVVFLGSSHAFCTFNPAIFYKENGIKGYVFASNEQPLWLSYHYLIEVLKTQKPEVIVLETFYISENNEYKKDGVNKLSLDDLPLTLNKIKAQNVAFEDNLEGVNPFYNYHNRWKEFNITDFKSKENGLLKGFTPLYKTTPKVIENFNVTKADLPVKSRLYLDKIIELANDNNIPLVLTYAPYNINASRNQHIKTVEEIALSQGIPFINYTDTTLLKTIKFDAQVDMEGGHTNVYGAQKVSEHLSNYLDNEFNFNPIKKSKDYEVLTSRFYAADSLKKIDDFDDYLNYLSNMDVYVAVTAMDAINKSTSIAFEKLGSQISFKDKFRVSYTGLFNNYRGYVEEKIDTMAIINKMQPNDKRNFYIRMESASFNTGNYSKIYINNVDQLINKSKRGFNIVVYDAVTNQILDTASFDTFETGNWSRY